MRIHALQTGTVAVKQRQRAGAGHGARRLLATMLDREWTAPLPIHAWAIEHPEGVIVVDTGETARAAQPGHFPRWHPYFRLGVREWVAPEQEIGPQLARLGIAVSDVRWVVLTHLHTDHAGGLGSFRDSEIVVSREQHGVARGLRGQVRGYLPQHWPDWFAPTLVDLDGDPYGPFPASHPLTRDGAVRILPTPGHAIGHVSVLVEDGAQRVLLAGDASYTQELMLAGVVDGVAPDEAAARESLARIRALGAAEPLVYLPSHDPDAARRLAAREPIPTSG